MAQRVRQITPEILRKIIVQEARKLQLEAKQEDAKRPEDLDAKEVDADGYADTLVDKVDFLKALGIHENRLRAKLAKVVEAKAKLTKKK